MRWFPILMLALTLSLHAENEKPINPAWLELSVCVQNVAWKFRTVPVDGAAAPEMFEDDVRTIDEALDKLVVDGELMERKVDLLPAEKLTNEDFKFLMDYALKLSEQYGYYTAAELIDMGLKKKLMMFKGREPVVLHVRLPGEQLNDLLEKLDEKELLMRVNEDQ